MGTVKKTITIEEELFQVHKSFLKNTIKERNVSSFVISEFKKDLQEIENIEALRNYLSQKKRLEKMNCSETKVTFP